MFVLLLLLTIKWGTYVVIVQDYGQMHFSVYTVQITYEKYEVSIIQVIITCHLGPYIA